MTDGNPDAAVKLTGPLTCVHVFDRNVSELSPTVRQVQNICNNEASVRKILQFTQAIAQDFLKMNDADLGKTIRNENFSQLTDEAKKKLLDDLRATLKNVDESSVRRWLALFAEGMQLAYEEYGEHAAAKHFRLDPGIDTCSYSPPQQRYIDTGRAVPQAPDQYFDAIALPPQRLCITLCNQCIDKHLPKATNDPYTAEQKVVRDGFEEAYHAYQYKDPIKKKEFADVPVISLGTVMDMSCTPLFDQHLG